MEPNTSSDQRPVIQASEILAKIERGEDVEYDGVIIEGDLDISGMELPIERVDRIKFDLQLGLSVELKVISSKVDVINSEIRGKTNFGNARLLKAISFRGTRVGGEVIFLGAKFSRDVDFFGAKFSGDVDLWGAEFSGDVDFELAELIGDGVFSGAKFGQKASFWQTDFAGDAEFWGSEFTGKTDFRSAEFTKDAVYLGAKFDDNADFSGAKFIGDVDFRKANFNKKLNLSRLKFNRLYVNWCLIKDNLVYDGPTYLALIKNFKVMEQFDDADNCYYQYRKESQARKKWYEEKGFNCSKLLDWIGFVSCGYGVRLGPIFLWVLGSILGFTFLYKLLPESRGGIAESGPSTVTIEVVNNSTHLLTLSPGDGVISPSWGDCLYFSFTALTGGTPDGLHPVGLVKYAVMVESVLGYLFLALFVVVLARKIIR